MSLMEVKFIKSSQRISIWDGWVISKKLATKKLLKSLRALDFLLRKIISLEKIYSVLREA